MAPLKNFTVLPFTSCHTHSYSASIGNTFLFYEGQFRVQHLAQGHLGMQMEKTGIELPTFWLEDNRSSTQPQPNATLHFSRPLIIPSTFNILIIPSVKLIKWQELLEWLMNCSSAEILMNEVFKLTVNGNLNFITATPNLTQLCVWPPRASMIPTSSGHAPDESADGVLGGSPSRPGSGFACFCLHCTCCHFQLHQSKWNWFTITWTS